MVFVSFDEMSLKLATCELYFLIFLFFSLFLLALVCLRFSMSRGPGRKGSFLESRRERERKVKFDSDGAATNWRERAYVKRVAWDK